MPVQIDIFEQNCEKAASMLLRFEKALPLDRRSCAERLQKFPVPQGLESEWNYVVSIWMAFYNQRYIDPADIDAPASIAHLLSPKIPHNSDEVRELILDIGNSINPVKNSLLEESVRAAAGISSQCGLSDLEHLASKEQIIACYKQYIGKLTASIEKIQMLSARNRKFERIQNNCLDRIHELLTASLDQMNEVANKTIWDKLVIAFFGETNAGKSTIIETFRVKFKDSLREAEIEKNNGEAVDGLIVGDGRSDFTQVYEKYSLSVDEKPFVLIDVPGIEGKEDNYLEEIGNALKQAHCVFYVQGHNTKPNAATAEKIKGFLSDWVDVYSIYNVRGGVSNYDEEEERELLLTTDVLEREKLIKGVFEEMLPDNYKGNVSCQGLLALLSVAEFHKSRADLIRSQDKIIKYFGNREKVFEFSRFSEIEGLIQSQLANFSQNIISANRNKLYGLSKRIILGLKAIQDEENMKMEALDEQLTAFKRSIIGYSNDIIPKMRGEMHSEVTEALSALRQASNDIIDSGSSKDEWSRRLRNSINSIQSILEKSIRDIYKSKTDDFRHRIELKRNDLDKIESLRFECPKFDIDINIDLSGVLDELTLDIGEILGSFWDGFTNPIRTLFKLPKDSQDGRTGAKRKVSAEIQKSKQLITKEVDAVIADVDRMVRKKTNSLCNSIESERKNISALKQEFEKLNREFNC